LQQFAAGDQTLSFAIVDDPVSFGALLGVAFTQMPIFRACHDANRAV
jgi:hypothetical protein